MRRVHLRGRENILKRVLIHVGGFNLSLVMRQLLRKATTRGLQGLSADAFTGFFAPLDRDSGEHRTGKHIGPDVSIVTPSPHRSFYSIAAERISHFCDGLLVSCPSDS
jgi:hypothetical protein